MSQPKHVRPAVAVLLALASAIPLAGCGSPSNGTAAAPTSEPIVSKSAGRPTDAQLVAFTEAFATKYPALADGHKARNIGYDADNTCLDIAGGNASQAQLVKRVQLRFARNDITPSAKTARGILRLIKEKACPQA